MPDIIKINGEKVEPGEDRFIYLDIARLPTYTNITLPVRILRSDKPGPVLLLSGGLHGDEINGIEIVRRLLVRDLIRPKRGTVIAVPLMNVYGFIQNVRGVPDGKDINRSFPGSTQGSLAKLVAYTIMKEIIPLIDYGIDFHTGGGSRTNYPQIRCTFDEKINRELAAAFSPPVILHSPFISKSFRKAVHQHNKTILVYETGETLRLDEHGISEAINGTLRLMKYLDMISSAPHSAAQPQIFAKSSWVRASYAGLFLSKVKIGDMVKKNQVLGYISDPYGSEKFTVKSRLKGKVIGLSMNPVVHKGDALLHIATQQLTNFIEVKKE